MKQKSVRLKPSDITPETVYEDRRRWIAMALAGAASSALPDLGEAANAPLPDKPSFKRNASLSVSEPMNTFEDITGYNNFYEFGLSKSDPAANAHTLKTRPWTVEIAGEAEVRGKFTIEDIIRPHALEERVYRFRCVEAWSMVVPWMGFPLSALLNRFKPTSRAKYVEFTTLHDPKQMPGQRYASLDWPYVEGLRIDEAMHPLTMMVVGVYGRWLPNQNGAPLRLVVPWKYGFKGIKSIVKIRFTEQQPRNSWAVETPHEYGFYANVNPEVDHPRWSQASERRLGGGLFAPRIATLPFNGYAEQVASLYKGLDLRRNF